MPRIELITPVYYQANDPYHFEIDNLPLRKIIERQELINLALDEVIEQMADAIGTQGSVANRLNQSINADGSLKTEAIDEALHSIEEHTDTDNYVRMTKAQSDKLDDIAAEATNIKIQIDTELFDSGIVIFEASSTVVPELEMPNIVKFNMAFPEEAAHRHYYGLTAVNANLITPDYINFKVNSMATPFIEDTLRVYINGVRIFDDVEIYVPGPLVDDSWTLLSFAPDHENGIFELSAAITEDDVIKVDFDIILV